MDEVFAGAITDAMLAPYDIFVVPTHIPNGIAPFSASEAAAVAAFVGAGNGLLAFNEYDTAPGGINSLTSQFGVTFSQDRIYDLSDNEAGTPFWSTIHLVSPHPVTCGVSSYTYYAGSCVSASPPASIIARGDGDAYSTYCQYFPGALAVYEAGGRAVFSGDETPIFGQQSGPLLLPNTLNWLLGTAIGVPGACCLADGTCDDALDRESCTAIGGIFQGSGTTCASAECTPSGACCFFPLACVDGMSQGDCGAEGGSFQGIGTACDVQCAKPEPGACCFSDGSCVDGMAQFACQMQGGVFRGPGSTCANDECNDSGPARYGWTISSSATDPFVNWGVPSGGIIPLYLWFVCDMSGVGLVAAEVGVSEIGRAHV